MPFSSSPARMRTRTTCSRPASRGSSRAATSATVIPACSAADLSATRCSTTWFFSTCSPTRSHTTLSGERKSIWGVGDHKCGSMRVQVHGFSLRGRSSSRRRRRGAATPGYVSWSRRVSVSRHPRLGSRSGTRPPGALAESFPSGGVQGVPANRRWRQNVMTWKPSATRARRLGWSRNSSRNRIPAASTPSLTP